MKPSEFADIRKAGSTPCAVPNCDDWGLHVAEVRAVQMFDTETNQRANPENAIVAFCSKHGGGLPVRGVHVGYAVESEEN